jgi:putative transcriptional regulator
MIEIKLEKLLADRKKSLYSLAKETGISYTALWNISKGKVQGITFDVLEKICLNLNCTPNEVLQIGK